LSQYELYQILSRIVLQSNANKLHPSSLVWLSNKPSQTDIDHRTVIRLAGPHQVIHGAQQRNPTCHQNRPIHSRNGDFLERRPEAEEEYEPKVCACKGIVGDTERTGDLPGSPYGAYHAIVGDGGCHVVKRSAAGEDGTCAATVEKQRGCEEVRSEKTGDGD